jgi:hypothetical protein
MPIFFDALRIYIEINELVTKDLINRLPDSAGNKLNL